MPTRPEEGLRERPPLGALRRRASVLLFAAGVLMLGEAALTVTWKEPFSALMQARAQDRLEAEVDELPATMPTLSPAIKDVDRRIDLLARHLDRRSGEGRALGRIEIDRIGVRAVVVQGTADASLRKAPGRYRATVLPGQAGTTGIAGHRTSYGAPFRRLDHLEGGDRIVLTMPYGRFTYRVERSRFVAAGGSAAFPRSGGRRLVLTACHPLFDDSRRILVHARLESRKPLGQAALAARQPTMPVVVDRDARYTRQLRRLGPRELSEGMTGAAVRELQRLLGLPRDGRFGATTAAAVRAFQGEHGLPADGHAGMATKRLLARRPRPPARPPTPPAVAPAPAPSATAPAQSVTGPGGPRPGSGM